MLIDELEKNIKNLASTIGSEDFDQAYMDQWLLANGNSFNSIFATDEYGVLLWLSPMEAGGNTVKPGTNLSSDKLIEKALLQKRPFVSHPYLSQTGRLLILISYPIFNQDGQYKGSDNLYGEFKFVK